MLRCNPSDTRESQPYQGGVAEPLLAYRHWRWDGGVCWGREHAAADAAAAAQGAGLRVGRGDVHAHETDTLSASGSWVQWFNVFERTFVVCCCFSLFFFAFVF